ncbi:MAG: hypothetical protein JJE09_02645 [Bacteroidia bacterium]|nr:hypothetical protein [Bacteroidia bacterium]
MKMKDQKLIYQKLKQLHVEVKSHTDLSYKSIPFFVKIVREIRVELLKVATVQGEQISRDVTHAIRLVNITEREDLNGIQNYPREIPKYLARVKDTIVKELLFVDK